MNGFWWLCLGVLIGWLVELVIDFRYWRVQAQKVQRELDARVRATGQREGAVELRENAVMVRERETAAFSASLNTRDAELLAQLKRLDEKAEELDRHEAAHEARRAEVEKLSVTVSERERDSAARSQKLRQDEQAAAARDRRLNETEADLARRLSAIGNRETASSGWEQRLNEREMQLARREHEAQAQVDRANALRHELEELRDLMGRGYRSADGRDRLETLHGIDLPTADILNKAGIDSFQRLADTPLGELTRTLEASSGKVALANPMNWAEQAALVASRDFVAFDRLQRELGSGAGQSAKREPGSRSLQTRQEQLAGMEADARQ